MVCVCVCGVDGVCGLEGHVKKHSPLLMQL